MSDFEVPAAARSFPSLERLLAAGRGPAAVASPPATGLEEAKFAAAAAGCNHPPLPVDEQEIVRALAELAVLEQGGDYEPATLLLGPYTAYVLIAVLQLAWRHPDLSEHHRQVIERIARPLEKLFGPPLAESIELGWNPFYDQAGGS